VKKKPGNEALQISLKNSKNQAFKIEKNINKKSRVRLKKKTFENASLETLEKQVTHPPSTLVGESWEYSFVRGVKTCNLL